MRKKQYKYYNHVSNITIALISNSLLEQIHTRTQNPFLNFSGTYCISPLSYNHDAFNTTHESLKNYSKTNKLLIKHYYA